MATKIAEYISTKEAGKEVSRSSRTIQRLCEEGIVKSKKWGRFYMIARTDWEDYKKRFFVDAA